MPRTRSKVTTSKTYQYPDEGQSSEGGGSQSFSSRIQRSGSPPGGLRGFGAPCGCSKCQRRQGRFPASSSCRYVLQQAQAYIQQAGMVADGRQDTHGNSECDRGSPHAQPMTDLYTNLLCLLCARQVPMHAALPHTQTCTHAQTCCMLIITASSADDAAQIVHSNSPC